MRVLAALFMLIFLPLAGNAFPELTRHGYTQCAACHFSPSGGGLLTPYGRELSAELLSRWSYKGEAGPLHGLISKSWAEKGVHLGGDVRAVQIHRESAVERSGQLFLMQAQLDAAYQKQNILIAVSLGEIEKPMDKVKRTNAFSPQYYAQAQLTDQLSVRAGRFQPQFGIRIPDHTIISRGFMGFPPDLKRDTVESNYLSENWSGSLAFTQTVPAESGAREQKAAVANASFSPTDKSKIVAGAWRGENRGKSWDLQFVGAIVGWSADFFTLFEIDRQELNSTPSVAALARTGYELTRGLVPYVQWQALEPIIAQPRTHAWTAGVQFFPRPHFELHGQWTRVNAPLSNSDQAYLLFHYYL